MKMSSKFNSKTEEKPVFTGAQIKGRPGVYQQKDSPFPSRVIVIDGATRLYVIGQGVCAAADSWFTDVRKYIEADELVTLTFQN